MGGAWPDSPTSKWKLPEDDLFGHRRFCSRMRASKIRSLGYWRSGERKTFHPSQLSPFLPQPNNGKDVSINPHVLLFVLAFVFVCVQQRLFVCAGDHFSSVLCKHTSLHTFFLPSFEHLSPVYLTLSI